LKKFKHFAVLISLVFLVGCGILGFSRSHVEAVPSVEGDHPLVGVWEWTTMNTYIYIFNADGSGSRGTVPTVQQFIWYECEDGHLHMTLGDGNAIEDWYKEIEDDLLTINNRHIPIMRYSYRRRAGS